MVTCQSCDRDCLIREFSAHSCDKCDHTAEISVITQQHLYKCQNVLYVYMTIFFYKDNINFVNLKSKTALEFQNLFTFFSNFNFLFYLSNLFSHSIKFQPQKDKDTVKVGIYAGGLLYILIIMHIFYGQAICTGI